MASAQVQAFPNERVPATLEISRSFPSNCGNGTLRLQSSTEVPSQSVQRGIRNVLRVSYQTGFSFKILVYVGDSTESHSIISLPTDWYGQILLHDGPISDSFILTGAEPEGNWRVGHGILLPAISGHESSGKELLRRKNTIKDLSWFGMPVDQGPSRYIERF
ncbi:hypothetical protein IL306_012932 [Fusarium sp. DS 682]|nr:hypothetical protein IL306_012932 [Fusarium sp. DS 682]